MKVSTRARRRSGALIASAAAGLIGVGLCATPASAHTPRWTVTCSEVTVDLKAYNDDVTNTVTITVDGKDLLPTKEFGSGFSETIKLPEHTAEAAVRLVVKAGDGDRFSHDETKSSPVCETTPPSQTPEPTPPPSETPKPEEPEPSETSSTEPPQSATPTPAPSTPGDLAETGGSSATPVIAGAAAVAVLAGGGILVVTRKRRAARG